MIKYMFSELLLRVRNSVEEECKERGKWIWSMTFVAQAYVCNKKNVIEWI